MLEITEELRDRAVAVLDMALQRIQELKEQVAALSALLSESAKMHYHCDDSWYCCGKCTHSGEYPSSHEHPTRVEGVCDCGADAWNAKVEGALK